MDIDVHNLWMYIHIRWYVHTMVCCIYPKFNNKNNNGSFTYSFSFLIYRLLDGHKYMAISYLLQPLEEQLMKLHLHSQRDHLCYLVHFWQESQCILFRLISKDDNIRLHLMAKKTLHSQFWISSLTSHI